MKKKHELLKFAYDNYPKGSLARFKTAPNVDHVSTGKFRIIEGTGNGTCVVSEEDNACFYGSDTDEWAEIVKPKVAVLVTTEKEVNAICKFKGWDYPNNPLWIGKRDCVIYLDGDGFYYNKLTDHCSKIYEDYQIIPFADFSKEHGIKLPLITSEDGIDLYEGDRYFMFDYEKGYNGEFDDFRGEGFKADHFPIKGYEKQPVIFSTKQAALSWIESQKPKETVLQFGAYKFTVKKDSVNVSHGDSDTFVDINSIYKAFLELN